MKISIITINRNNKVGLEKTMHSVFSQSVYDNIEYIIIDGASTDGSRDIIESNSQLISKWVSEPDSGIYNAMNKGVKLATRQFLLFLNSGDWLAEDNIIERALSSIEHNSSYNNAIIMGSVQGICNGEKKGELRSYNAALNSAWDIFCSGIPHQSAFIPRHLLLQNPYDESYKICADFKFFFNQIVIHNSPVIHIDLCIAYYDLSGISSINHKLSENERRKAFLELLPPFFREDYKRILPFKSSRFRIKWILSRRWLCNILKFISSIGMRLCE